MISAHRCSEVSCLACSVELYWNVCFSCICGWDPQTPTSPAKHFLWVMVIHWPTLSPLWVFFTSHLASRNSLQLKKEVAPTFRTSFTLAWRGPASELCMWLLVQPLCCTVHLFPPPHTHTQSIKYHSRLWGRSVECNPIQPLDHSLMKETWMCEQPRANSEAGGRKTVFKFGFSHIDIGKMLSISEQLFLLCVVVFCLGNLSNGKNGWERITDCFQNGIITQV